MVDKGALPKMFSKDGAVGWVGGWGGRVGGRCAVVFRACGGWP
jgi:hypothetical protein